MRNAPQRWQEWTSFALGLWLAMSPWICGYESQQAATANAVFVGIALALGSHFEASLDAWEAEWLNLAAGMWLVAAPFMLGFGDLGAATANSVLVGTLIVTLAASALSLDTHLEKWWHKV